MKMCCIKTALFVAFCLCAYELYDLITDNIVMEEKLDVAKHEIEATNEAYKTAMEEKDKINERLESKRKVLQDIISHDCDFHNTVIPDRLREEICGTSSGKASASEVPADRHSTSGQK